MSPLLLLPLASFASREVGWGGVGSTQCTHNSMCGAGRAGATRGSSSCGQNTKANSWCPKNEEHGAAHWRRVMWLRYWGVSVVVKSAQALMLLQNVLLKLRRSAYHIHCRSRTCTPIACACAVVPRLRNTATPFFTFPFSFATQQ